MIITKNLVVTDHQERALKSALLKSMSDEKLTNFEEEILNKSMWMVREGSLPGWVLKPQNLMVGG